MEARSIPIAREEPALLTAVRDHAPLLVFAWVYAALGSWVIGENWLGIRLVPHGELWQMSVLCLFAALLAHCARAVLRPNGARETLHPETVRIFMRGLSMERVIGAMLALSLFGPIVGTFSQFKYWLPSFHPFRFDADFVEIDHVLHLGVDPWRLTAWVPALVTNAIDILYFVGWGSANLFMFAWTCWSPRSVQRTQYLVTFALVWTVIGSAAAITLSSAGPVYFDRITGSDHFAPLFTHLSAVHESRPLWTMEVREYLWTAYESGQRGEYTGITAMPSMHVASALLVWLGARNIHRFAGYAGAVLFAFVLFGSVHLGWHYAIDGYVSILLTLALWFGAGCFSRWWLNETSGS